MKISLELNGRPAHWDVEPGEDLLSALRRHGTLSVKRGCDTASCGTCTVLMDGKPVPSCAVPAPRVDGHAITTVEGLEQVADRLGALLVAEGADQCGFCSPGLVVAVAAMAEELDDPSEEEILHYLSGNLCRCGGYVSQTRAIRKYLEETS